MHSLNNVDTIKVFVEQGKYIRRAGDTRYLHVHRDDPFVEWADSSHTLNKTFEFTVDPETHVIRTHDDQCLIWKDEVGSFIQAEGTHSRAVTFVEDPTRLERTYAKSFENINNRLQYRAFKRFSLFMEKAISEEIETKKDKKFFMKSTWRNMTYEEKEDWI